MVAYVFRCPEDGPFEVRAPMGTAPSASRCARCGEPARRSFSAPMTREGSSSARTLLQASERSAHEPQVVSAPPARTAAAQRRAGGNPALRRLPRP